MDANSTENEISNFTDDAVDLPPRNLGIFDLIFYVTMPGILAVSICVLINIVVELKKTRPHHRILLGLCISDIMGSSFGFLYPGLRRVYDTRSHSCALVVFFLRAGILGGTSFVGLLSAERFLALKAPFWYDLHVTGRRSVGASVLTFALIIAISATTFFGHSYISPEVGSSGNSTGRNLCSIFPAGVGNDVSSLFLKLLPFHPFKYFQLYVGVTVTNILVTILLNVQVVWTLKKMKQRVGHGTANVIQAESNRQETALIRMVIALSVISIVTNFPSGLLNLTRLLGGSIPEWARLTSTVLLSMGFVLDPCVHLIFNAKYRQRIGRWLRCRFRDDPLPEAAVTSVMEATASTSSRRSAVISTASKFASLPVGGHVTNANAMALPEV